MHLALALDVARRTVARAPGYTTDPNLRIYRARNGQYMTARTGNPAMYGRPMWTMQDFIKEHA